MNALNLTHCLIILQNLQLVRDSVPCRRPILLSVKHQVYSAREYENDSNAGLWASA